ncbi:MAG: TonB-dependent receptor, partial [Myxococcales bacterium]|nr:TonB-dependent receptor [Myxococcales bacterium]
EVFKGPAAISHGPNTIGGAVNLRTRQIPAAPEGFVDLAAGRFGYGKAHTYWGTTYKGFGVLLEGVRVQSNGFKRLDNGGDTGFGKNDTMLKLGYRSPEERRTVHVVEAKLGYASESSYETYLGLSDADFSADPYRRYAASQLGRMKWWRSQAEVSYVVSQRDGIEVEARAYRHDMNRAWRKLNRFADGVVPTPDLATILGNPDAAALQTYAQILRGQQDSTVGEPNEVLLIGTNDRTFVSQGVQAMMRWRPRWKRFGQDLEFGARLHNDFIERDHTEAPFLMTSGVLVPEGGPTVQTTNNRGAALAAAFHLQDALLIGKRLTVAPGLRVEVISTHFDDRLASAASPDPMAEARPDDTQRLDVVPVPGVGAYVQATPWLGILGGVHRGFSPVSPGQPEEVRPEFSVNYELGARAGWEGLRAEAVGFLSDYSNLTASCTISAGCEDSILGTQFNGGAVYVYGVESLVGYEHRFGSGLVLGGGARYTYTGSQFRTAFMSGFSQFGDVEVGDQLPYVPQHLAGVDGHVGGRIWDARATLSTMGPMRDVAGQGEIPEAERIPGRVLLDLSGEVRVLRMFRLYALVNNATANHSIVSRRPFGARPAAPLTFILGIKAHILP